MTVAVVNVKMRRRLGGAIELGFSAMTAQMLEIRASGDPVATTLRTPGHDRELALGLLLAKGIIESARDVATVTHCGRVGDDSRRNTIDVRAAPGLAFDLERAEVPSERNVLVARSELAARVPALRERCACARSGGLHAAAILDASGGVLAMHDDVGALNSVDKAIGAWLLQAELNAPSTTPAVLVVSGRVTAEIVQRAARARIDIVCSELDLDR
jgi:FdhD protein